MVLPLGVNNRKKKNMSMTFYNRILRNLIENMVRSAELHHIVNVIRHNCLCSLAKKIN